MIKLIALDVDGTIVAEGTGVVTPVVCRAIASAAAKGVTIVLCTGRGRDELQDVLDQLDIPPGYHVAGGGSEVLGPNGEVLSSQYLALQELDELNGCTEQFPLERMYLVDGMWCYHYPPQQAHRVALVSLTANSHAQAEKLRGDLSFLVPRYSVVVASDSRDKNRAVVHLSSGTSHKGAGLARVLNLVGVSPQNAAMVGDMMNDLPAFAVVGTSVAMGNAPHAVKSKAHFVVSDVTQDGAAEAIRKLLEMKELHKTFCQEG